MGTIKPSFTFFYPPNISTSHERTLCLFTISDDEMTLFTCVYRWLEAKKESMQASGEENIDLHIDHYIRTLLIHIRFPMMTPAQLADLLLNPLSQTHTELLVERIRIAMSYHKNMVELSKGREKVGSIHGGRDAFGVRQLRSIKCVTLMNLFQVPTIPVGCVQTTYPRGDRIFTPRLYTVGKFCASLSIDYFFNLQAYHCRSLVFSSQKFTAEWAGDEQAEWVVDVYPKGVWFQRCLTVYRPPGMEVSR